MKFKKIALAFAAAASLGGMTSANAGLSFDIDTGFAGGAFGVVTVDNMSAVYEELATFGAGNTVAFSGKYNISAFNLGGTPQSTGVTSANVGSATTYHLYGLFQGTGTFDPGTGTISSNAGSMFTLWLDSDWDTVISAPVSGLGSDPFVVTAGGGNDLKLVDGLILNGLATGVTAAGGFVDQLSQVALTTAGESFFVSPDPFYSLSIQTGNIQNALTTTAGTTNRITGGLTITFAVPEPGSLALAGVALLGVAGALRKRRA